MKKKYKLQPVSRFLAAFCLAGAVCWLAFIPASAQAQCETPAPANDALADLVTEDIRNINRFILQEENFIDALLSDEALRDVSDRLRNYSRDARQALGSWWTKYQTALKGLTAQYNTAQIDHSYRLGALTDARLMVDLGNRYADEIINGRRRYAPAPLSCEIDTIGQNKVRVFAISQALAERLTNDDTPRRSNDADSIAAVGTEAELNVAWKEYIDKFCDMSMGDQACTQILPDFPKPPPGPLASRHKDIPALLWGNKQTIDANEDNLLVMRASLRYLIHPLGSFPVHPKVVDFSEGHLALLDRRSQLAYTNTIYNTMSRMMSERIAGSGVDVQLKRAAAGVPPQDASVNASYRELQEMMTRDRYYNPEYLVRLLEEPAQMAREQNAVNALRLQTMNDIYRRSEEMLFMEAAAYSRDLYQQVPGDGSEAMKK